MVYLLFFFRTRSGKALLPKNGLISSVVEAVKRSKDSAFFFLFLLLHFYFGVSYS